MLRACKHQLLACRPALSTAMRGLAAQSCRSREWGLWPCPGNAVVFAADQPPVRWPKSGAPHRWSNLCRPPQRPHHTEPTAQGATHSRLGLARRTGCPLYAFRGPRLPVGDCMLQHLDSKVYPSHLQSDGDRPLPGKGVLFSPQLLQHPLHLSLHVAQLLLQLAGAIRLRGQRGSRL